MTPFPPGAAAGPGALSWIDWVVVAVFLLVSTGVGMSFARHAGKDTTSFFLSGRSLVWPVACVSMLATSFAADTPLWVSGLVRQHGISVVWQYWAGFIGASLCAVTFARWWRRAGVTTDVEVIELRYSGKPAALLRAWNGFCGAVVLCPLTIAWVTKAMEMIAREALGLPPEWQRLVIAGVLLLALLSCVLSGLDGVVYSDLMLFVASAVGSVLLAGFVAHAAGGLQAVGDALRSGAAGSPRFLQVIPTIGASPGEMSPWNAFAYFGLIWLFSASGSGHHIQRLMSCRDSRHAGLAKAMFAIVYFGLLSWPWIVTALGSLVLMPVLPEGISNESAYVRMARMVLPVGVQGLVFASLAAAFVSSINSMLNWGSSYVVNDLYRRFLVRDALPHHYVTVGRVATVGLAIAGGVVASKADSIQQLLQISLIVGGAMGPIVVLRWLWPGLTALGELSAVTAGWATACFMVLGPADAVFGPLFHVPEGVSFAFDYRWMGARIFLSALLGTSVAGLVSVLGPKTDPVHLARFATRLRMPAVVWGGVLRRAGLPAEGLESVPRTLVSWLLIAGAIFLILLGILDVLFASAAVGGAFLAAAVAALWLASLRLARDARRERESEAVRERRAESAGEIPARN